MMGITGKHWCVALLGAVLIHAAVATVALWEAPVVGAGGAGVGGIEISLGPAGGAPGSVPASVTEAEEAETVEATEAQEAPQPEAVTAHERPAGTATASEVVDAETAEPVETETVETETVEQAVEAEPQETEAVETPEVETVAAPEIEDVETPEVETAAATQPTERVEAEKPLPPLPESRPRELPDPVRKAEPEPEPEPQEVAEPAGQPNPEAVQTAKATPSTAGTQGKAGTSDSSEAGSSSASTGGGNPGEVADYMARLQAWLERHKEYPRRAKLRRQEGTVLLYFVMNREGRVLEYKLRRSSGHASLDHAVEEMIERAQPLPKMPQEMRQARLELVVPVQFYLR